MSFSFALHCNQVPSELQVRVWYLPLRVKVAKCRLTFLRLPPCVIVTVGQDQFDQFEHTDFEDQKQLARVSRAAREKKKSTETNRTTVTSRKGWFLFFRQLPRFQVSKISLFIFHDYLPLSRSGRPELPTSTPPTNSKDHSLIYQSGGRGTACCPVTSCVAGSEQVCPCNPSTRKCSNQVRHI
jgi:hypothetical protein